MMREAKIILPTELSQFTASEDYATGADVHEMIRRKLARDFGGYTATYGHGGWISGDGNLIEEHVTIYTVAVVIGNEDGKRFERLVKHVADVSGEDTVYHVFPDGVVDFT